MVMNWEGGGGNAQIIRHAVGLMWLEREKGQSVNKSLFHQANYMMNCIDITKTKTHQKDGFR